MCSLVSVLGVLPDGRRLYVRYEADLVQNQMASKQALPHIPLQRIKNGWFSDSSSLVALQQLGYSAAMNKYGDEQFIFVSVLWYQLVFY